MHAQEHRNCDIAMQCAIISILKANVKSCFENRHPWKEYWLPQLPGSIAPDINVHTPAIGRLQWGGLECCVRCAVREGESKYARIGDLILPSFINRATWGVCRATREGDRRYRKEGYLISPSCLTQRNRHLDLPLLQQLRQHCLYLIF